MFETEKRKVILIHGIAAVLAIITVALAADHYLWSTLSKKLYPDELINMLLIGGLIFTLHLCVMPFFDEEYDKLGLLFAVTEGIVIFITLGAMLIVHAQHHLKYVFRNPINGEEKVYYRDAYWNIIAAGGTALGAGGVFAVELVLLLCKQELFE